MGPAPDAAPPQSTSPVPGPGAGGLVRPASLVEPVLRLQNEVLEAIAAGDPLATVATLICRRVEVIVPGVLASILRVDRDGRLQHLAAPSLPVEFETAFNGLPIGPAVGSCGTAAFRRQAVEVADIATDPLWAPYRHVVLPHGIVSCWSTPILDASGAVLGTFAFYSRQRRGSDDRQREIVRACIHLCSIALEQEEVRSRNHRLAYYDALTGLPNRTLFHDLLKLRLSEAEPAVGLLLIDIDHFKTINDTLGHHIGDAAIVEISDRLRRASLPGTVCRLGGDEFAVIVEGCPSAPALAAVARRIIRLVDPPFASDGQTIPLRVTIGGALLGDEGTDGDVLYQNADLALDQAKRSRRGGYLRFRKDLRVATTTRARAVRAVDLALREGRIVAYYQPIVRLQSGVVEKFEALARMRTPDGEILPARDFHHAFSDPKVAHDLTGRMLTAVSGDLAGWIAAGLEAPLVAINLSTGDFQHGDLEARFARVFRKAGVPLDRLMLEVTETAMMDSSNRAVARAVAALRRRGIRVALDDFGTGFASLTHLLDFPVDVIKIDKSFVDRVLVDNESTVIVEALIGIARRLKMQVVAEGIETPAQRERLKSLGCTLGQGYLFSRPIPAAAVGRMLARTSDDAAALAVVE